MCFALMKVHCSCIYVDMSDSPVSDIPSLIDALGGTAAHAAKVLGMTPSGLSNAKKKGVLPRASSLSQWLRLRELGIEAGPALWGVEQIPENSEQAA